VWQVVASVQPCVALLSTEQPFEPVGPRVLRKKGRDVASFDGVLEALTGQTFMICTFIVHPTFFQCVSGALIRS
jgi:DNA-binding helix-hairpin-helix protein with protein kinase domain